MTKRATTTQTAFDKGYSEGVRDGYKSRDAQSVWGDDYPLQYWRWKEWTGYTVANAVGIGVGIVLFWLVGAFIRWEVGPIPRVPLPYPIRDGGLNPGWHGCICRPGDASKGEGDYVCTFSKDQQ